MGLRCRKPKQSTESILPIAIPGKRAAFLGSRRSHSLRVAVLRFAGGLAARCGASLRHPGFTMIGQKTTHRLNTTNNKTTTPHPQYTRSEPKSGKEKLANFRKKESRRAGEGKASKIHATRIADQHCKIQGRHGRSGT